MNPTHSLKDEVARIEAIPHHERHDALEAAALRSFGHYAKPGSGSHLFEVSHMGVHARADSENELVLNWLRAARNVCKSIEPQQNIKLDAARMMQQVDRARAMAMISSSDHVPAPALLEACELILRTSDDPFERTCAEQIAKTLARAA